MMVKIEITHHQCVDALQSISFDEKDCYNLTCQYYLYVQNAISKFSKKCRMKFHRQKSELFMLTSADLRSTLW